MANGAPDVVAELRRRANPARARLLARFFKTGAGEYGQGDVFWGLTVPQVRAVAARTPDLTPIELQKLLKHRVHEVRLCGLLLMVRRYVRGNDRTKRETFELYLKWRSRVNSWDLVDLSAPNIVGEQLRSSGHGIAQLRRLARSASVWDRRIAVLATFAYIKVGRPAPSLALAKLLLNDRHDLIHKAVGWMLREVGKRCGEQHLRLFLDRYGPRMPRTMLRYAIERLPERLRRRYLTAGS